MPAEDGVSSDGPPDGAAPGSDASSGNDGRSITRREAFGYAGGAAVGLSGWRALDNVLLGYGAVGGTNLFEQDLASYVAADLSVRHGEIRRGEYEVRTDGEAVAVYEADRRRSGIDLAEATSEDARRLDAVFGLEGSPVTELYDDLTALRDGRVRFEFSTTGPFFDRIRATEARPATVAALRGPAFGSADAASVAEFADVESAATEALVEGLAEGFREHSRYDVPRYLAGSVEDNVLLGRVDLREHFESPSDFEALLEGRNSGLFCTELATRSIEAFHAVPAAAQTLPVAAGFVQDTRHKHAYTALASVVRDDGDLVVPVTFVDYTHATLYDDLHLRAVLGEGIEAYDDRHRTTGVYWNEMAGV